MFQLLAPPPLQATFRLSSTHTPVAFFPLTVACEKSPDDLLKLDPRTK